MKEKKGFRSFLRRTGLRMRKRGGKRYKEKRFATTRGRKGTAEGQHMVGIGTHLRNIREIVREIGRVEVSTGIVFSNKKRKKLKEAETRVGEITPRRGRKTRKKEERKASVAHGSGNLQEKKHRLPIPAGA